MVKKGNKRTTFVPFEEKKLVHSTNKRLELELVNNEILYKDIIQNTPEKNELLKKNILKTYELNAKSFPSLVVKEPIKQKEQVVHKTTQKQDDMNEEQKHKKCNVQVTDLTITGGKEKSPVTDLKVKTDVQFDRQISLKRLIIEQFDKKGIVPVTELTKNDECSKTDIKTIMNVQDNVGSQSSIERKKLQGNIVQPSYSNIYREQNDGKGKHPDTDIKLKMNVPVEGQSYAEKKKLQGNIVQPSYSNIYREQNDGKGKHPDTDIKLKTNVRVEGQSYAEKKKLQGNIVKPSYSNTYREQNDGKGKRSDTDIKLKTNVRVRGQIKKLTTFAPFEEKTIDSINESQDDINVEQKDTKCSDQVTDLTITGGKEKNPVTDLKVKTDVQFNGQIFEEEKKLILDETNIDIFKLPKEYSLAHCVSEELKIETGFAIDFKRKFGGLGKLVDQNLKVGDVGVVNNHNQNVFYLITKRFSHFKSSMRTMERALYSLYTRMKILNLTKLGISKIGCGFDEVEWNDMMSFIKKLFAGSGIHITVCIPSKIPDHKMPLLPLKVTVTMDNVWEMEGETTIIIFINIEETLENDWTDITINKVDDRYPFKERLLYDLKNKVINPGDIEHYPVGDEMIICVFIQRPAYYSCVESAFKKIHRLYKENYTFLAIQSGPIKNVSKEISWIVFIYRSVFTNSELWICGDTGQTTNMFYEQYCRKKRIAFTNFFKN